ncbi:MAG: glycoside hydrolase family 9 protein [Chitinispirillaceae bacterium]
MKRILTSAVIMLMAWQVSAQNYSELHDLLIKFYGYQRAGLENGSANNLNSGFTDAAHSGDSYNGHALDGGWYDAADYIKFGMNLGYTVYTLLKGYDVFPNAYDDNYSFDHSNTPDGIPDILNQVKYATDYMMKAVISENTVVLDVGLASEEHLGMEDMPNSGGRTQSHQIRLADGGDIPATYAACLALMSTLYRPYDSEYADDCLAKAKAAFSFAKAKFDAGADYCTPQEKRGKTLYAYTDGAEQIGDRKAAAGVELYRASEDEDPIYREWANASIVDQYNCMGYGFIGPLASFEVWRQGLGSAASLVANVAFIEGRVQEEGFFEGIYQNSGWGTARDAGTAAFEYALAYIVTSSTDTRDRYHQRIEDHIGWIIGNNGSQPRSYVVGYNSGPTSLHYRTNYPNGDPQGALVSGPDGDGNWENNESAEFCEVAIDYNAGIIGAVAFLKALDDPGDAIQMTQSFTADPKVEADFRSGNVTFSAGFSSSVPWRIDITGFNGSKSFTGTGTSINEIWDGTADEGFFLGGESVAAKLSIEGEIVAYDIQKARAFTVSIEKAVRPELGSEYKVIDDFEDSDLDNAVGGVWEPFGTGTGFGATRSDFSEEDGSVALEMTGTVGSAGAEEYAGLRTTFNAEESAGSIGDVQSVAFDLKSSKNANVCVELEQANVTDGAYHRVVFPVKTVSNFYRIPIEEFAQPDWKTSDVPLDLNNITALRFTVYDNTSMIRLWLDNVAIEGYSSSTVSRLSRKGNVAFSPTVKNNSLVFSMPRSAAGNLEMTVYDIAGKVVKKADFSAVSGKVCSMSLRGLPAGMYTVRSKVNGEASGGSTRFLLAK